MCTPIFVCGHPKSGTTLLTALLDGHSQVVVFPEETAYLAHVRHQSDFTPEFGAKWLLEDSTVNYLAQGKTDRPLDGNHDYSTINFAMLQNRFLTKLQSDKLNHGQVLEALMTAYAEATDQVGKRYWVEKTPSQEHYLNLPTQWYPDMRAIYLVRDPRDVYTSYSRKKQIETARHQPLSVDSFICRWGASLWAWQKYTAQHASGLLIRYEDLVRYPKETMGLVCRFLDIGYESSLELPTKNGVLWDGNSMHNDKFSGISTKPIERWQQSLSEQHVATIETYLGKAMLSLGYRRVTAPASLTQLFRELCHHKHKKRMVATLILLYWPFCLPKRWMQ